MSASKPRGVRIKRVYEDPAPSDGRRVLVDRLWPRGLRKERAAVDEWLRDIAPNTPLRKWFGHDPERWAEFRRRYRDELSTRSAELAILRERAQEGPVTLLYGARDPDINHAVVLKGLLEAKSGAQKPAARKRRVRKARAQKHRARASRTRQGRTKPAARRSRAGQKRASASGSRRSVSKATSR